jgi:pimeloyl-ACP methyl ester carboxylesterase
MPFQTINCHKIYYEIHGEAEETIILLHHGFGSLKIWKGIYPALVSEGFKVLMFDRRGFGRSEEGSDFQEFYQNEVRYRTESVEELKELTSFLNIGQCHLIGQCEGGVVSVDYAVKYPHEVLSLAAASTQCYSDVPMIELNEKKLVVKFSELEPRLQLKMIEWHGDAAQRRYDLFAKCGGTYGLSYFDLRPNLARVQCPALVLYPDRSAIFDVEQAIVFYRNLPNGELAVFPKCGHNTYDQRAEDYTRTFLDFIKRIKKGAEPSQPPIVSCLA